MSITLPALTPSRSTRMAARHQIHDIRYGQGHGVRMRDGAHPLEMRWTVLWEGLRVAEAASLHHAFTASNGVDSFTWQAPGESTSHHYICLEWQVTPTSHETRKVEALFMRVHQQTGGA